MTTNRTIWSYKLGDRVRVVGSQDMLIASAKYYEPVLGKLGTIRVTPPGQCIGKYLFVKVDSFPYSDKAGCISEHMFTSEEIEPYAAIKIDDNGNIN